MNECERYEICLSAWLDGDDGGTERLEVLDHLVRCAGCRRFYREGRALAGLTAAAASPARGGGPGPERWARIVAASRPTVRPPAQVPAWALRAAAALAIAAAAVWALWVPATPARRGAPPATQLEVVLEEDAHAMTESRFVELTAEVLRADRRFHRALYRVMEQVVTDTEAGETSLNESPGDAEGDDAGEGGSETRERQERA